MDKRLLCTEHYFLMTGKRLIAAGLKYRSQVTGHLSQVIVLPIQKVSQTLVKANLRPKNFCLGLIRPKVSFCFWDTFCNGKTMNCDLYFSPVGLIVSFYVNARINGLYNLERLSFKETIMLHWL